MKKGFTLVELLATIILLGALMALSYPKIIELMEKKEKEIVNNKEQLIYSAVDSYITDNLDIYPKIIGNRYCFLISSLDKENLIPFEIGDYKSKAVNVKIGKKNSYVIKDGQCGSNDVTPPILTLGIASATTNRITIKATASDPESEIVKYEYAIDSGNYVDNGNINVFTFYGLNESTHLIKVKVTNADDISTETTMYAKPNTITTPIYSISSTGWAISKNVTITYPTREEGFVFQYSLNGGGSWVTVNTGSITTLTFTSNGSVIARVYDGINYKTASSFTVNGVDSTGPSVPNFAITNVQMRSGFYTISITSGSSDPESGIWGYQYTIDSGASGTGITGAAYNVGIGGPLYHAIYVRAFNPVGLASGWSPGLGVDAKTLFIMQNYIHCLGRVPSAGEVSIHYNSGLPVSNLSYNICTSEESHHRNSAMRRADGTVLLHNQGVTKALYRGILGREGDAGGVNYFTNYGLTYGFDAVVKELINSQEFKDLCAIYGLPWTGV